MALTNVPSDPAACGQQFTPSSPAFFWDFRRHKREFSRESPDRLVYLGLDVLLDALIDVLLVAVGFAGPQARTLHATTIRSLLFASGMSGDVVVRLDPCGL